uniref:DNA-directed DNA polymerase n=1 Tax=Tanacetum cinerariifolium TaxID=118510 RepID=A0A6L2P8M7_TANCI|nr:DNA-directed DNA polymerase [Tanacetum cinerariifolium]
MLASSLIVILINVVLSTTTVTISLVVSFVVDLCDDGREQVLKLKSDHCGDVGIPTNVAIATIVTIVAGVTFARNALTDSINHFYYKLFPPLDNTELTIQRRSRTDPTLLNNSEMAAERNVNGVTDDALHVYLFSHSLTHHATAWFDRLPRNSINTFGQMAKMFLGKYFPSSMVTKLRNKITNFRQRPDESLFEAWERYKLSIDQCPNHNMFPITQIDTFYNDLTLRHRDTINAAAGGTFMKRRLEECYDLIENMTAHHNDWDTSAQWTTVGNTQNVYAVGPYQDSNLELKNMFGQFMKMNTASSSGLGTLPGNKITNPKEDLKGITTRSGTAYQGPTIPTTSSLPPVVERETEVTKDTVHPTNNGSTKDVQPLLNQSPSIPYPSILHDQKLCDKANDQREKFFQIFNDLNFNISFDDALILMLKFGPSIKSLLTNKDKLFELARTPLNEHCLAVLLKKFPKKLRDLGKFHFPADFVVVDFDADPRVPLILERSFLKTRRAMIDVFEGELTLHVGKKDITSNLDQTSRYSANYNDMTANQINVIDMACEEYSQEVLGFSDVIASGNPTPYYDPIVSTTSLTLTLFGNSDFLLEEVDAFLALEDDPTSPKVDQSYVNTEGDILLLEAFLNDDPSLPPPNQGNYLPYDLPPHLEYAFLEGDDKLLVIIAKDLSAEEKTALITEDFEPAVEHQIRANLKIHDVIKNEVLKILDAGLLYPISDSPWVSPVHCVPKKGGFTVVEYEENELIPTRLVTGWRVYIDYRYLQIPIDPKDQEKTTFTCPYGMFAYRRMPFGLCNALGMFQRCMMAIFHDMIKKTIEVFMDDFSVFGNSFQICLSHLKRMLKRCEDTNLCLNWEKSHFMFKEGIRPMVPNPTNPREDILEPLSKMAEGDKKKYIADVKKRIKRLMHRSAIFDNVSHSWLMDEFDKFTAKEGESIESMYERLTTLVNIMDRNNVRPITVEINTKFLNCLQPEWSKYVTMVCQNQSDKAISYDELYDSLVQFESHVLASRAKKAAKNHHLLALINHLNASSSHPYACSSYSLQSYHVTGFNTLFGEKEWGIFLKETGHRPS